MNAETKPTATPEARPPQARRKASLISRRYVRRRFQEHIQGRVTVDALDAIEAIFNAHLDRMMEFAREERRKEIAARACQQVRFRTPPLKRVHLAPFIDPPAEPARGAVSSIGPQGVDSGRTDTPEADQT